MIEIRHPRYDEVNDVEELWHFAFGDGPAFQQDFYRRCAPEGPLALMEDGELRSMLVLPKVTLRFGDGWSVRAGYVYALATQVGFGGKGWASALLNCAAGLGAEWGLDCLITAPATPGLFRFYEKNGFAPGFYLREIAARSGLFPAPASPVSQAEYNGLREELLSDRTHVSYTESQIAFQRYLCGLCQRPGSGLYRLELAHGPGCAAVESLDRPLVKELLCASEDEAQGAAACAALCGAPVRVRVPVGAEDGQPFGAVRWLFSKAPSRWQSCPEGWLGLAFD